jgi:hypothetical protein
MTRDLQRDMTTVPNIPCRYDTTNDHCEKKVRDTLLFHDGPESSPSRRMYPGYTWRCGLTQAVMIGLYQQG